MRDTIQFMPRERQPCTYILASQRNGTFYVGVTSDLLARIFRHRNRHTAGFVAEHDVYRLVYYEMHGDMEHAIRREKAIKRWKREYKLNLIERHNPEWVDLAVELGSEPVAPVKEGGGAGAASLP